MRPIAKPSMLPKGRSPTHMARLGARTVRWPSAFFACRIVTSMTRVRHERLSGDGGTVTAGQLSATATNNNATVSNLANVTRTSSPTDHRWLGRAETCHFAFDLPGRKGLGGQYRSICNGDTGRHSASGADPAKLETLRAIEVGNQPQGCLRLRQVNLSARGRCVVRAKRNFQNELRSTRVPLYAELRLRLLRQCHDEAHTQANLLVDLKIGR